MQRTIRQGIGIAVAVVVSLMVCTGCAHFGSNEADQVISMSDLPAAVRLLAEKEVAGSKIIEVEKEMKEGKVIYAITYDQAGTKMEVEYAEDGALISKGKE